MREQLIQVDREFSAHCQEAGIAKAFVAFASDDAVMYRSGMRPIKGRASIGELLASDPEARLEWEPFHAEVAESGDLGYTLGDWTHTSKGPDGNEKIVTGCYVSIWRRQPDGSWRWVFDTGSPTPPPQADADGTYS